MLTYSLDECARLWAQHREALLADWRAAGFRGTPWAVRKYDRDESPATLPFPSPYSADRGRHPAGINAEDEEGTDANE